MLRARLALAVVFASCLAGAVGLSRQESAAAGEPLTIQYLANEGFLLRGNGRSVMIDAFIGEPYFEYAALPPDLLKRLKAAQAPFDAIDLALTSHIHRDHFQAEVACNFLAADKDVPMWSAKQVIDALRAHCAELPEASTRLRSFWCESGKSLSGEVAGLKVEFFPLFHVKDIQNLAHLIHFGERTLLHVGDAGLIEKEYAPYELAKRKIDVALLPYWYFLDKEDCAKVQAWIRAKRYVAMHVPPKEFADVRKTISTNLPGVLMLEKGGEATLIESSN